jgi:hypothetical protein
LCAKICSKTRLWLPPWPLWLCYNRRGHPQVAVERSKSAQIQKFASRLLSSRCGFSASCWPFRPRFRAPGALGSAGGFFAPNHPNLRPPICPCSSPSGPAFEIALFCTRCSFKVFAWFVRSIGKKNSSGGSLRCQKIGAVGLNSPVTGAPWSGLASLPGPRLSHPDSPAV